MRGRGGGRNDTPPHHIHRLLIGHFIPEPIGRHDHKLAVRGYRHLGHLRLRRDHLLQVRVPDGSGNREHAVDAPHAALVAVDVAAERLDARALVLPGGLVVPRERVGGAGAGEHGAAVARVGDGERARGEPEGDDARAAGFRLRGDVEERGDDRGEGGGSECE